MEGRGGVPAHRGLAVLEPLVNLSKLSLDLPQERIGPAGQ
jgi:hypothetical protein